MFNLRVLLGSVCLLMVANAWAISSEMKEAHTFIETTNQGPAQPIEPLPAFPAPALYLYSAGNLRSPFDSPPPQANSSKDAPDLNRPREFLEAYALDALHMVGTLSKDGQTWGLVSTPNNMIYRVKVGSHLGENYGEVTAISQGEISLVETVPNGVGGWSKRDVSLSLSNEQQQQQQQ